MLWTGQWKPATPAPEFVEVVITATVVPALQQATVIPTTIRPTSIATMGAEPHFT